MSAKPDGRQSAIFQYGGFWGYARDAEYLPHIFYSNKHVLHEYEEKFRQL